MKKVKILLVLLASTLCLVGCKKETKTLKVGIVPVAKPYVYYDENQKLLGFDVEVGLEIAKRMNVKIEYVEYGGFDAIIPALTTEKVDVLITAVTITDKRKEKVNFSAPYLSDGKDKIAVPINNPLNIQTLEDLKGKKVTCVAGAVQCDTLEKIGDVVIVQTDTTADAFLLVVTGNADATLEPIDSINACLTSQCKDKIKILDEVVQGGQLGVVLNKKDTELLKEVNKALVLIKKDGTLKQITEKYGFNYDKELENINE